MPADGSVGVCIKKNTKLFFCGLHRFASDACQLGNASHEKNPKSGASHLDTPDIWPRLYSIYPL